MSKIHIPTPIITTYSEPVYTSDREHDFQREEAKLSDIVEAAHNKAMAELGDKFNDASSFWSMNDEPLPVGLVRMARYLPDDLKPWVRCESCGYEKPIHTPCGLPCV